MNEIGCAAISFLSFSSEMHRYFPDDTLSTTVARMSAAGKDVLTSEIFLSSSWRDRPIFHSRWGYRLNVQDSPDPGPMKHLVFSLNRCVVVAPG